MIIWRSIIFKVYGLIRPDHTKIRYVGVTKRSVESRIYRHLQRLELKIKQKPELKLTYKENWLTGFVENFEVNEVDYRIIDKFKKEEDAYEKEKELIGEFDDLTNIDEGGKAPPCYSGEDHPHYGKDKSDMFSEEVLGRMSKEMEGEKNPLYNTNIFEVWEGRYDKEEAKRRESEWRNKLSHSIRNSEKFKENRFSDEWKEKMSKSRGMDVYILDEDETIIEKFHSCTKASEWLGCTRGNVKNARRQERKVQGKYFIVSVDDFHSEDFEL